MAGAHLQLDGEDRSVSAARQWVTAQALERHVPPAVARVVELLTSELVANAVVHASGQSIDVHVEDDDTSLTVSVTDDSDAMPVIRTTGPEVPGGHGMRLVDRLSAGWGAEPRPQGGKTTWFRVARGATG